MQKLFPHPKISFQPQGFPYQENMEITSVKVSKDSFESLDFLVITFMREKD